HRAAARLGLTVRDGLGAGQPILALGDRPADGSHVRWLASPVQRTRSALVRVKRGGLLGRRRRVARDSDVVVVVGDPGVERDQVVLGRELSLLELLLLLLPLPLVARPQKEEVAARTKQDEDTQDDQANGWSAGGRFTG